jgi:hypothetical protein
MGIVRALARGRRRPRLETLQPTTQRGPRLRTVGKSANRVAVPVRDWTLWFADRGAGNHGAAEFLYSFHNCTARTQQLKLRQAPV